MKKAQEHLFPEFVQAAGLIDLLQKLFIVVFTGDDNDVVIKNFVNQPMFSCDTAGPMSGPIPFEQLRLTGSMKRGPQYLGNKRINLLVDFLVFFGPLAIFSKSGIRKTDQFSAAHFSALCRASSTVLKVIMLPSSTSCIDLFSRSRLAGEPYCYRLLQIPL